MEGTAASLRELAEKSNAWPFEEARKIVTRLERRPKDEVVFETGYGPSGLPHIGTFAEVARTTMVRHAFRVLTSDKVRTRLIAFSDDMDGFRRVPDNVPNRDMLEQHLGKPLTKVPDPFGTHPSFGEHNNARLRTFLDQFSFDYEFLSSTACYTSGRFDATLLRVLERFDQVMAIMLPSLREERAQSYSPFLPIDPQSGVVLQVPVLTHDAGAGTITYEDPRTGEHMTISITGGRAKLQWKPDWAMRWAALGIDYEMAGKDLIDSVNLSGDICRALGGVPPEGFIYELFLDDKGQKISKSNPALHQMVGYAIQYFRDFVRPTKTFREPNTIERAALSDLRDALAQLPAEAGAEQIQDVVYEIGRREPFLDPEKKAKDGRPGVSLEWFDMLYQVLLGQEKGPRFGSFVAVYGLANAIEMIDGTLARSA